MNTYSGSCHCGDLRIQYRTALPLAEWPLRECQCTFCRKHAMLSTSDPDGEILVIVRDPASLRRYRFATGVTDFLVCARCGVYMGATVVNDSRMVINGRVMDCAADLLARAAEPKHFEQQSADERIERRQQVWSRCRIESVGTHQA